MRSMVRAEHVPIIGMSEHSLLGVGALVSPLIATQFAQLHQWSFHYLAALGVALTNTIALIVVFRFKTQDGSPVLSE